MRHLFSFDAEPMIGVFDSGIGGLTVLAEIHQALPEAPLCYVADQKFAPYGNQPELFVSERSVRITQWLIQQGCTLIVVACNTATAIAIRQLRGEFAVPIVGVEPGVKPAALRSLSQKIAILATDNTLASRRYQALLEQFLPRVEVISQGCTGLAAAIERCSDELPALLHEYCSPLIDNGIDQIVLGCTHYPLVKDEIAQLCSPSVSVVDTSYAIAQEVKRRFAEGEPSNAGEAGVRLFSTHSTEHDLAAAINRYRLLRLFSAAALSTVEI
ncbi:glutamate racemase [Reinekea marinisedimentorum]|uniref:Glutamate racemase n=1 Tax=Reinekea marinisedimentorum TaxID=230495 RepID=A0A4R3I8E9_9GAMM|nr:glutamate racemase [Reinekea marinisedimentorum]TCS42091.1 glutamate racemase [Reinekea marinisedimentorum]